LNFGNAERAESPVDGMKHESGFLTLGTLELAEALFEFSVCGLDDEKRVIDVWPGVVFGLVPSVGALLQGFAVSLLILFDEALQADVSTNLEPQMVALQEQKEP